MPKLSLAYPKYQKHRASGQAVVTLCGKDFYLGPHGTKTSRLEYDRLIAEWLINGRRIILPSDRQQLSAVEVLLAYKRFADGYYVKNGKVTNEVTAIASAMRVVKRLYGKLPAAEFGPLKLQAVQQAMIDQGWSRKHINKQISRVVRLFAWATSKEMVPAHIPQALREVPGLHVGRCAAREAAPVQPVADQIVQQTLPHLPVAVADLVRLQRLTGARPEEVCMVRPCDIDRTDEEVWRYSPATHKTQHHGKERVIFFGPKAQAILTPYLLRPCEIYCFSPAESERQRRQAAHEARVVPLSCGNRPGTNRRKKPARPAGKCYTTGSYRRAIHRACELAFLMPEELRKPPKLETPPAKAQRLKAAAAWRAQHCWSPNQLRHSAATEIRKRFGLEAAQVTLGHAAASVTEIYAERDLDRARGIMREVG